MSTPSRWQQTLAEAALLTPAALLLAFVAFCWADGQRWSDLKQEVSALPAGADRESALRMVHEVGLRPSIVDPSDADDWRCTTEWTLTPEQRTQAASVVLVRQDWAVVPNECVLVFDGQGRLLKAVLNT